MIQGFKVFVRNNSWELILFLVLVMAVIAAAVLSPLYLSFDQITYSLQQSIAIVGILALGFMLVMVLGEIDISLPAILAIGNVLFAEFSLMGVPLYLALPIVILACAILGAINGLLIVSFNLPSMAVTLGTMGAYRAIALLIGGVGGYASGAFQESYLWLGSTYFFGALPASLILLFILVAVFILVMHKTVFGRLLYAVGNNRVATRFSGHNVPAIIVSAFTAAGAMAGLAALVFVGQFESARSDNASSILLFIVACVVLGGVEASGGKGKVIGLLLSLLIVGTLQNGMGLANIPGPVQTTIIGCILIGAVWAPVLWTRIGSFMRRRRNQAGAVLSEPQTAEPPSLKVLPGAVTMAAGVVVPRLSLRGISKSYGGIRALHNIDFDVMPGTIHAICGENGAGKSTLVKIITGLQPADGGQVLLDGVPIRFRSPMEARRAGVLAVYQDPKLFPNLSVAENVFMGIHPLTRFKTVDRRKMNQRTRELLQDLGVDLDPAAVVAGLSIAEMQYVEFARAMSEGDIRLLILDEPTASLTPGETERLFMIIRQLKKRGASIILISHRIEELEGLVDTITVLRDGEHVVTKSQSELRQADVVKLMVGRSLENLYETTPTFKKDPADRTRAKLLRVERLSQVGVFKDISFTLYSGEILCLAGLVGAGRTEIAQTIFGITPPTAGRVFVGEKEVTIKNPRQMLGYGVAYLPEDRETQGLISQLSILKNMSLPSIGKLARFGGFIDEKRERAICDEYTTRLQIKLASLDAVVSSLSGGNRQKVVLTKWLVMNPRVLILDEPTHGIDVGTKAQVHQMIAELAEQGMGILLISSDLPEVLRLSDRILVISDGRLVAEFERKDATQEKIMLAAATGKNHAY